MFVVDLLLGLDVNFGEVEFCVYVVYIIIFFSFKWCYIVYLVVCYCGELEVYDIGFDFVDDDGECFDDVDEYCDFVEMVLLWLVFGVFDDKYFCGVVGIDIGFEKFLGVVVFGVFGVLCIGLGMVWFFGLSVIMVFILSWVLFVVIGEGCV